MTTDDKPKLKPKIEKRLKERENLAIAIQTDIDSLAEKLNKLMDHDLKTYTMLTEPDSLFNDCPLSHFWTYRWIKDYMIKKDMDFIGYALDGKPSLKTLNERFTDSSKWAIRFTKDPEPKKTGIDTII